MEPIGLMLVMKLVVMKLVVFVVVLAPIAMTRFSALVLLEEEDSEKELEEELAK